MSERIIREDADGKPTESQQFWDHFGVQQSAGRQMMWDSGQARGRKVGRWEGFVIGVAAASVVIALIANTWSPI